MGRGWTQVQTEEMATMPARTYDDSGAPTVELQAYRDAQLRVRDLGESDERCSIALTPLPSLGTE